MSAWVYLLQRASAMVMAPLVVLHIVLIIYAIHGGLTAEEILSRTRGSMTWGAIYLVFVIAAVVHAGIGVRNLAREWLRTSHVIVDLCAFMFACLLMTLGVRAVIAVTSVTGGGL